jgi:hypothetical protein
MELVNQIFLVVMTNENWLINRIFGVFEKKKYAHISISSHEVTSVCNRG